MERKIGEIFEYEGEWCQCVESKQDDCTDCAFNPINGIGYNCSGSCTYKQVIFKKLEKVGEPYDFDGHLFQSYRTFEVPIFTENYATVRESGNNSKISIEIKQTKEDMEEKNEIKLNDLVNEYVNELIDFEEFKKGIKEWCEENSNIKSVGNNLKSFSLEEAKAGKPVCTRDGRSVRIICFDAKCNLPIIALITDAGGDESLARYNSNGRFTNLNESDCDLMMLPEKKEGWVNIDKGGSGKIAVSSPYSTKEEAIHNDNETTIDTIKICWEE